MLTFTSKSDENLMAVLVSSEPASEISEIFAIPAAEAARRISSVNHSGSLVLVLEAVMAFAISSNFPAGRSQTLASLSAGGTCGS